MVPHLEGYWFSAPLLSLFTLTSEFLSTRENRRSNGERERGGKERRWEGGIATAERVERQTRKRGRPMVSRSSWTDWSNAAI